MVSLVKILDEIFWNFEKILEKIWGRFGNFSKKCWELMEKF